MAIIFPYLLGEELSRKPSVKAPILYQEDNPYMRKEYGKDPREV